MCFGGGGWKKLFGNLLSYQMEKNGTGSKKKKNFLKFVVGIEKIYGDKRSPSIMTMCACVWGKSIYTI